MLTNNFYKAMAGALCDDSERKGCKNGNKKFLQGNQSPISSSKCQ